MHSPASCNLAATYTTLASPADQTAAEQHYHQQNYQQQSPSQPGAYPYHSSPGGNRGALGTFLQHRRAGAAATPGVLPNRGGGSHVPPPGQGNAAAAAAPAWDTSKAYSNMAQYQSNPVGALQERFQSRGIAPQYRMVQAEGASHCPTFSFQVLVADYLAMGSGSSKKQAKHNAARAMLDKLDGRVPAQDGLQPLPPVGAPTGDTNSTSATTEDSSSANGNGKKAGANSAMSTTSSSSLAAAASNTIGQLQELCVHRGLPMPIYDLAAVDGQPHQRSFAMKVKVGSLSERGEGTSKKDAKRDAAAKMMMRLQALREGSGSNDVNTEEDGADDVANSTLSAEDEELARTVQAMKIDTLTPKNSLEIQNFYQDLASKNNLKNASSSAMFRLHRSSFVGRSREACTQLLKELSDEQKFEVTYVELEEREEDSAEPVLCIVQLSTLPVAVCCGRGPDKEAAEQDAAKNALIYLKIMTKSPFPSGNAPCK